MSDQPSLQDFLRSRQDLALRTRAEWATADYSLERMQALMAALGQPQGRYASLHVAGSNGKGSVCALASAALLAQGRRVGRYTSPHIEGPLEGIWLNGEVAALDALESTWTGMRPAALAQEGLTAFELVTALALQFFADQDVEVAVIEVGLGGRLDATNVVQPAVSVITPIDLEHQHILGESLAQIAAEKGGIIKDGVPVVLAPQEVEAAEVLRQLAAERQAPLIEVGRQERFEILNADAQGQDLRLWRQEQPAEALDLRLGLLGAHQALNAATAYAALGALSPELAVSAAALAAGFAAVQWPARLELVAQKPPVLLDGAHTPAAARALARALEAHFPQRPVVALLGVSEDKAPVALLQPLQGRLRALYATQSSHGRALPAASLAAGLEGSGIPVRASGSLEAMLTEARQAARGEGAMLLIFGSLYLAQQARRLLR